MLKLKMMNLTTQEYINSIGILATMIELDTTLGALLEQHLITERECKESLALCGTLWIRIDKWQSIREDSKEREWRRQDALNHAKTLLQYAVEF